jgi:hypothetical protein
MSIRYQQEPVHAVISSGTTIATTASAGFRFPQNVGSIQVQNETAGNLHIKFGTQTYPTVGASTYTAPDVIVKAGETRVFDVPNRELAVYNAGGGTATYAGSSKDFIICGWPLH